MSRKVKVCLALFLSFAVLAQYSFTPQAMVAYGMDNTVEAAQAEDSGSDSGQSSEKQEATKPAPEPTKATEAPAPTPAPAATTESTQATEPTEATTVPEEQSDDVEDENDVNTGDPIAGEDPAAEEEEAAEEDEEEEWEHSFSGSCNGLTVKVSAPDGAFKKGTKMNLSAISDATAASIVSSVLPEDKEVADVVGVDISFSYKGSKDQPNESVKVSISGANLEGDNPVLYHKHGGAVEQSGASNNGASITTGAFSPFILATSVDGEEDTWTVNFRNRDGEVIETRNVIQGEAIGDLPPTIDREDYNAYWAIGTHQSGDQGGTWVAGDRIDSSYVPEKDVDIVPGYSKVSYTVSFYESEEATEAIATRTVDVDTSYCLNDIPSVPHKEGYTGKWVYSGGDFNNNVQIKNDTKVWAEYEKTVFTVTYEYKLSGQDVKVYQTDKYYKGDTLTLPSEPVEEGHEFVGWHVGETQYVGGEKVTSDLTLQGEFTDMYFVKFVVLNDDGTVKETLTQYFRTEGDKIETMPQNPFVAGKQFKNWVIQGTETEVTADTVVDRDIVAVAVFDTIDKYTIETKYWYEGNSGNVLFDSAIIEVATTDLPYTITPPASTQTDPDEVAGGPVYYPTKTSVTVKQSDFNEGRKCVIDVEYVEYTAEYDFVYLLKNLTGDGYSEIGRESNVKGVLGSYVTPTVRDYDYATLEAAEGATIEQAEGQELNVKYTRKSFQLTYETAGGSYVAGTTAPYGTEVALSTTVPTRDGYTFAGWYLDEDCTTAAGSSVTLEKDTTIYAKWTGNQVNYTIVYMFEKYNDTGTESSYVYDNSSEGTATVGTTVQASSAPTITRTGWVIDSDKNASSSAEIKADGSSVLYVYYKLQTYTLNFDRNHRNWHDDYIVRPNGTHTTGTYSISVKLGQDISSLWPSADCDDCYFVGWTKGGTSGTRYITKQLIMNTDLLPTNGTSVTWYANWTDRATQRTVNYYLQNADDDNYTKSDTYSQTYYTTSNSTLNPKAITGYTYDHSNNTTNTYNFYYNRDTFKIDYYYSSTNLKTINNVKFDATITSNTYNWTPTAAQCGVDSDYTFAGWYSDSGLTTKYTFSKMPASNLVLYAKWTPPTYTVSFDVDGGTPAIDDQTVAKYSKAEKPANPTKNGYRFEGWYTTKDGSTLFDWATQITSDTTIYAHWTLEPLSYTVHYVDGEGGALAPDKTVTNPNFEVGQKVTETAVTIAGYRPDAGTKDVTLQLGTNEITFVYSEKSDETSYIVKYVLADGEPGAGTPVAADKEVEHVDGNTLSVIEFAVEATLDGQELYPDAVEKTLVLGADPSSNVLYFYYSRYQSLNIKVNFVDMNGDKIADTDTQTLKVGNTFTLSKTPIAGWELNKAVIGKSYSGATANNSYKITEDLMEEHSNGLEFTLFYQKKVTITAASLTKQYDGEALTLPEELDGQVMIEGEDISITDLESISFDYVGNDVANGRENAGTATVTPKNAKLKGDNAAGNYYKIRYISGTLEVTKINVTVRIEPDRWTGITYDGTAKKVGFTNNSKSVEDYILISHEGYSAEYLDDIWDAVKAKATYDASAAGLKYYVVERTDVCDDSYDLGLTVADLPKDDNYSVSLYVRSGRVQILPMEATVTTGSDSKPYDGTALTNEEASIEGLVDADKEKVTIAATGSQTEVGKSSNTYEITWGGVSSNNYSITEELGTLEVTKASLTVSVGDATKPYNGEEQSGETEYTVAGLAEGHKLTVSYTPAKGTDVGSGYTGSFAKEFTITDGDGNDVSRYYDVENIEFESGKLEITPLKVTVTITGNKDSKPYNGEEQKVEGYKVEINNDLYTEDDFEFSGEAVAKGTDVNTYPMGLAENQFTNNNDNFDVTFAVTDGQLEITPLAVTVTITGHKDSKQYSGEEQKVEGYDVEISDPLYTESDFTFSGEAVAKGTDVDTYPMGLAEDQFTNNNDNFDVTFAVTDGQLLITKADIVVDITGHKDVKDYSGEEQKVEGYDVTIPKGADFTEDDIVFSGEAIAKGTDVDTYPMGLAKDQFSVTSTNYDVDFNVTDGQLKITPLAVTVTITGNTESKPYSGEEQKVEGYEVTSISSDLYTEDDFTFSGEAAAKGTDVDTYNMGLSKEQFTNDNDNFDVTFSVTDGQLEITPLEVTVTITGNTDSKPYSGEEQKVEGYDTSISSELYTEDDFTFSGEAIAKGTDVDTYDMGLNEEQFTNNNDNFDVTFSVTDGQLEITPLEVTVTITGNKDSKAYNGEEQKVEGYEVTNISSKLYTEKDFTFNGEAVATGTNAGSYPMGLAEDQFTNNNDNFEVTFSVTDGQLQITPLAVTVEIAGNTDSKVYNGEEQKVEGYEVKSISSNLYTEGDFTFEGEAVATGTNAGSYPMGLAEDQFTNNNDNFEVTFSITDGKLTITKKPIRINITGNNKETKYDGTFQTVEGYTAASDDSMFDSTKVKYSGGPIAVGGTDAKTYEIGLDKQYFSYDDQNMDPTFVVTDGKLTITKRNVTVTSASATKTYDGTALTNNKVTVSGDGFVEGETPAFRVTGSQTAVGSSKNTFDILPNVSASALNELRAMANGYKAGNYNITKVYGTLTVTEASTPTPTPTPTPDGGGNNPGGGVTPAAPFNPIPAAIDDTPAPTTIIDDDAPRAATGFWALINLICAILTALLSLIMLIRYFGKRREEDEETGEVTEIKRKGGVKLASIISAIGAIIAFILTEDMSLPMQMIDKWTILMVVILAIQVLVAFFSRKKEEEEDQEDEGAMA